MANENAITRIQLKTKITKNSDGNNTFYIKGSWEGEDISPSCKLNETSIDISSNNVAQKVDNLNGGPYVKLNALSEGVTLYWTYTDATNPSNFSKWEVGDYAKDSNGTLIEIPVNLSEITLDRGEPLFDSNTNKLHIGNSNETGDKKTTFMPMKKDGVYEISDDGDLEVSVADTISLKSNNLELTSDSMNLNIGSDAAKIGINSAGNVTLSAKDLAVEVENKICLESPKINLNSNEFNVGSDAATIKIDNWRDSSMAPQGSIDIYTSDKNYVKLASVSDEAGDHNRVDINSNGFITLSSPNVNVTATNRIDVSATEGIILKSNTQLRGNLTDADNQTSFYTLGNAECEKECTAPLDLNTLVNVGVYNIPYDVAFNTTTYEVIADNFPSNRPYGGASKLVVEKDSSGRVSQTLRIFNNHDNSRSSTYQREYYNSTWGPWRRLLADTDILPSDYIPSSQSSVLKDSYWPLLVRTENSIDEGDNKSPLIGMAASDILRVNSNDKAISIGSQFEAKLNKQEISSDKYKNELLIYPTDAGMISHNFRIGKDKGNYPGCVYILCKHTDNSDSNHSGYSLRTVGNINSNQDITCSGKMRTHNLIVGEVRDFTQQPGDIYVAGKVDASSFNARSDARLKENFQPLTCEKSILDLPTYKFDFINGSKNQIGCKAQDLREICPEIVDESSDGYLSIQESKIVYLLLEEVKKLKKEIDILRG